MFYHRQHKGRFLSETAFMSFGGDKEDRTPDLLNAIQALSQLSYTPKFWKICYFKEILPKTNNFTLSPQKRGV